MPVVLLLIVVAWILRFGSKLVCKSVVSMPSLHRCMNAINSQLAFMLP